jgi:hypothetical protein
MEYEKRILFIGFLLKAIIFPLFFQSHEIEFRGLPRLGLLDSIGLI